MVQTAVALIIFNRPSTTSRVFAEIARAKPRRLFVIADGPRANRDGEAALCAAAREVTERVDWDCEVMRNYSNTNLGNFRRVPSGISWAFEHVEELIVLEDDCVPDQTFFRVLRGASGAVSYGRTDHAHCRQSSPAANPTPGPFQLHVRAVEYRVGLGDLEASLAAFRYHTLSVAGAARDEVPG